MSHRIAETRADVDVLIDVLKGTHRESRSDRIASFALAAFLVGVAALIARSGELFSYVIALILLIAGAASILEALATLTVDRTGFSRRSRLRQRAVRPDELRTIDYDVAKQTLIFETVDGKRRATHLGNDARNAVGKLYPEFGDPVEIATLPVEQQREVVQFNWKLTGIKLRFPLLPVAVALLLAWWHPGDPHAEGRAGHGLRRRDTSQHRFRIDRRDSRAVRRSDALHTEAAVRDLRHRPR
ncbi:MAG TPA: hypothetical protein VHA53_06635, partial [Nitrolancea sp.]|nr:hypothetical protein [Nitrolancea sp.]